jgi:GDP-4-dehydro-6-deoxy-D-mannose reductase
MSDPVERMKVLVTGASGFVGVHLMAELADAGHEAVATDIAAPGGRGEPAFPAGVAFRRCDLEDASAVRELVAGVRPDGVVHLAAQSSAAASLEAPRATLETNVFGTLNLLEAVRAASPACPAARTASGKMRVLSIGSAEEYGARPRSEMPLGERSRVEPASPYAVSKAAQTMLAVQYARSYSLDVVATRSFGHTGSGQPERFVLPSFAKQCAEIAAGKRPPVVRTGRLDVVRDYLDVRDVVRAYRLLLERGTEGEIYNVCSGEGVALGDALSFFVRACGAEVAVEEDPRLLRPADIQMLVGDNAKLVRDCGFERSIGVDTMLGDLFAHWERVARET